MNILIITTHLNIGGIGRYVINLAKALARESNTLFVASSGGQWQKELIFDKITHLKIPINTKSILSPKILKSFFILSKFLKDQKIDIIHANTRVAQSLGYLLYKIKKIPYVSTFHGCYRPHIFRRLFRFEGLRSIAVSNFVRKHATSRLGVAEKNTRVIYNGMDIAACLDKQRFSEFESIKKRLDGFPLIGAVSRLSPEKNTRFLIEAMPDLIERFPGIRLVILGQGRREGQLKDRVKALGLGQAVIFLKGMDPCLLLKDLDVFITLSQGEPFGFSVIEAQSLEVPVIALASGALKETIQDRVTGILVNDTRPNSLVEALTLILDNKQLRQSIVRKAKTRVEERFTIERMAQDTFNLYKEVVG